MSRYSSYSSGIGERILSIDDFRGIDQSRGTHHSDYGTSPDAINFISRHGKLYTAGGAAPYGAPAGLDSDCKGRLFQAFFRDSEGRDISKMLMFVDGCIYASDNDAQSWVIIGSGFHSDNWDAVNYRDGVDDWVVMTNGVDNVQYWDGMADSVSMLLNASDIDLEIEEGVGDSSTDEESSDEEEGVTAGFIPDVEVMVGENISINGFGFPWDYISNTELSVSVSVDNSALASVTPTVVNSENDDVTFTALGVGDVTITMRVAETLDPIDYGYLSEHSAILRVRINDDIEFITLEYPGYEDPTNEEIWAGRPNAGELQVGKSIKINANTTPAAHSEKLVWESSNENVAIVDQEGNVTAISPGFSSIVCYPAGRKDIVSAYFSLNCYEPSVVCDDSEVVKTEEGLQLPLSAYRIAKTSVSSSEYDIYNVLSDGSFGLRIDTFDSSLYCRDVIVVPFSEITSGLPNGYSMEMLNFDVWARNEAGTSFTVGYALYNSAADDDKRSNLISLINAKSNKVVFPVTDQKVYKNIDLLSAFKSGTYDCFVLFDTGSFSSVGTYSSNSGDCELLCNFRYRYNLSGEAIEPEPVIEVEPKPIPSIIQGGDVLVFSQIALLKERLWGAVSPMYPDRIYWSNAFDPNDWELDWEDSSNVGGGFIDIATFDGTRIRAIISAFDEVLVFKDKSIHRITGSSPGEFSVASVYSSEGTLAPRSIVYTGDKVYFLTVDGLCVYNGVTAAPMSALGDRKLRDIWKRINESTISTACAVLKDNIIYLAVPLDGSVINTHVIEYNLYDGTYSIIALPGVDDWLLMREGQKETLLYLDGDQVCQYDRGYTFRQNSIDAYWISPEISGGSLSSRKTTGRVYMRVEAHSIDYGEFPQIKISMISGNKIREKVIKLKDGVNDIRKRVKVRGRTFRFKIENVDGNPLTIHKGMEIVLEEDYD